MSARSDSSDALLTVAALLLGIGALLVMVRVAAVPGLVLCVAGAAIYAARRGRPERTVTGPAASGPQDVLRDDAGMPVLGRSAAAPDSFSGAPLNGRPTEPHVVLPAGPAVPVRGVAVHAQVLAPYARAGGDAWVAVTLSTDDEDGLVVRLDGARIGHLGPEAVEDLRPLVRHVAARGLTPVAAATVRGSALTTEVVLHCVRAQHVDDAWLRGLPGSSP